MIKSVGDVMEKIGMDYPYSSVNIETNKRISMNKDIGGVYSKIINIIENGKRVRNIGQSIAIYDKIWASIK